MTKSIIAHLLFIIFQYRMKLKINQGAEKYEKADCYYIHHWISSIYDLG